MSSWNSLRFTRLWLFSPSAEEPDEELGIQRGKVELENSFLDERLDRLSGVLLKLPGNPFDSAPQIVSVG